MGLVDSSRPYRLAHVVTHPIQYFAPLYRELARRPEIDLRVYFCSDASLREFNDPEFGRPIAWDSDLTSGYRWELLPSGRGRSVSDVRRRPQWELRRALTAGNFDGIWVHGYAYPNAWLAASVARLTKRNLLIREEQTLLDERPMIKRGIKRPLLRELFRRAKGLYIGEANRRYFEHYGLPASQLFYTPYCVDNAKFQAAAAELSPQRMAVRSSFGIADDAPVVLFSGKLIDKKQPLLLLDAFERVRRRTSCWLLYVGDGPLAPDIDRRVAERSIPGVIRAGFINQSALPRAYTAADIFVLPSVRQETWGLVVNEALNFGLPVIVSDKVGCAVNLVDNGENGFVIPAGDVDALARRLTELVESSALRRRFGARSRQIVDAYTVDRCADGIVAACLNRSASSQ